MLPLSIPQCPYSNASCVLLVSLLPGPFRHVPDKRAHETRDHWEALEREQRELSEVTITSLIILHHTEPFFNIIKWPTNPFTQTVLVAILYFLEQCWVALKSCYIDKY